MYPTEYYHKTHNSYAHLTSHSFSATIPGFSGLGAKLHNDNSISVVTNINKNSLSLFKNLTIKNALKLGCGPNIPLEYTKSGLEVALGYSCGFLIFNISLSGTFYPLDKLGDIELGVGMFGTEYGAKLESQNIADEMMNELYDFIEYYNHPQAYF